MAQWYQVFFDRCELRDKSAIPPDLLDPAKRAKQYQHVGRVDPAEDFVTAMRNASTGKVGIDSGLYDVFFELEDVPGGKKAGWGWAVPKQQP